LQELTKNWKKIVAYSDESRFLLRHSDGRVRIWREQNGIFSWHTLGPLVPIGHV